MKKMENGLICLKSNRNSSLNKIALTMKTMNSGNVRYGIVITDKRGRHTYLGTSLTILPVWNAYKALRAM